MSTKIRSKSVVFHQATAGFSSALNLQVARSEALAVDAACLTGVEDLLTLGDFNEPVPRWQTLCGVSHVFICVLIHDLMSHDGLIVFFFKLQF